MINNLMDKISGLKNERGYNRFYGDDMTAIRSCFSEWISKQPWDDEIKQLRNSINELKAENGLLEAKSYMYEQIISKSNFAPMVCNGQKPEADWMVASYCPFCGSMDVLFDDKTHKNNCLNCGGVFRGKLENEDD